VHLRVGGLTIQLAWNESDLKGLRLAPSAASVPFMVAASPPDVTIDVTTTPRVGGMPARECLFDSGGPWRLYRDGDGFLFRFFAPRSGDSPYKTARFTPDFSRGVVSLDREFFTDGTADPLEYPLDELLIISLLARGRGVEIHGCGLVDRESGGLLFVGQSGAGKSTMARRWSSAAAAVILSDDRIVLRRDAEGLWMYGTPWHGEAPLASPRRSRIAGVFLLRQAALDDIVAVPAAAAVARLFAASFPPFHDAGGLGFSLEFLESLVSAVPCAELRSTAGPAVIPLVRDHLRR